MDNKGLKEQIRKGAPSAFGGVTGGPKKQLYYLPDNTEVWRIPAEREYAKKVDGKVVEQGTRDANYDKGWTDAPRATPLVSCLYCGKFHDTEDEVVTCKERSQKFIKKHDDEAQSNVEALSARVDKMESKLDLILEKLGG